MIINVPESIDIFISLEYYTYRIVEITRRVQLWELAVQHFFNKYIGQTFDITNVWLVFLFLCNTFELK